MEFELAGISSNTLFSFAACPAIYAAFSWIEDRLSPASKSVCADFILRRGKFQNSSTYFIAANDFVFGKTLFSLHRISIALIIALGSFVLANSIGATEIRSYGSHDVFTIVLFIVPTILFGVSSSRFVLENLSGRTNIGTFMLIIIDLVVKFTVLFFMVKLYGFLYIREKEGLGRMLEVIGMLKIASGAMLGILALWLFMLSSVITHKLSNVLDIEKQPLKSLGVVFASTFGLGLILSYLPQLLSGPGIGDD